MTLNDLPDRAYVLVDSNIFVYAFGETSKECLLFTQRCRNEQVFGFVSTVTLAEVCHRTMGIEAADELGRKSVSARYLEEHPDLVRHLNKYARYMENLIQRCNLTIFEISETDLLGSQRIRDRYGLLTNDSINLHIALANGIGAIATHDDDFDTVGEIRVFKPSDL